MPAEAPDVSTQTSIVGTATLVRLFGLSLGTTPVYREKTRRFGEAVATTSTELRHRLEGETIHYRRMVHVLKSGQRFREGAFYRVEPDRVLLMARRLVSGYDQVLEPGQVVIRGPLKVGNAWKGSFVVREENRKVRVRSAPTRIDYSGRIMARETVKTEVGSFEDCYKVELVTGPYRVLLWLHPEAGEVRREGYSKGQLMGRLILVGGVKPSKTASR